MAAGYEVPKGMFIHGFLLMEGHKMSKSLGNVLDPFEVIERFGADALRYYCFREVSFGQDGSVSAAGFESRYDTELANEYGNLASRTLAMIDRYRDGRVPEAEPGPRARASGDDGLAGLEDTVARAAGSRRADPGAGGDLGAGAAAQPLRRGDAARGTSPRTSDQADAAGPACLYSLAEGLRVVTLLLHAYMPEAGEPAARRRSPRGAASWPPSARAAAASAVDEAAAALSEDRGSPRLALAIPPSGRDVDGRSRLPS